MCSMTTAISVVTKMYKIIDFTIQTTKISVMNKYILKNHSNRTTFKKKNDSIVRIKQKNVRLLNICKI